MPEVELDPDVVLVVFLPPLLYGAAFFANLGDIAPRTCAASTLNSVGLVLVTMVVVAVVAHALISGLPWAAAFALGAVVSPTDPLAGATIMRRLGVPRRLVSAIEAEGLFNDATALVAYKVAIAAVVGGEFSLAEAGLRFVAGAAGGHRDRARRRLGDRRDPHAHGRTPRSSITISLLSAATPRSSPPTRSAPRACWPR